jgi:hypothetical protein
METPGDRGTRRASYMSKSAKTERKDERGFFLFVALRKRADPHELPQRGDVALMRPDDAQITETEKREFLILRARFTAKQAEAIREDIKNRFRLRVPIDSQKYLTRAQVKNLDDPRKTVEPMDLEIGTLETKTEKGKDA